MDEGILQISEVLEHRALPAVGERTVFFPRLVLDSHAHREHQSGIPDDSHPDLRLVFVERIAVEGFREPGSIRPSGVVEVVGNELMELGIGIGVVVWIVGVIDAYLIGQKLERGEPVEEWEFFWKS